MSIVTLPLKIPEDTMSKGKLRQFCINNIAILENMASHMQANVGLLIMINNYVHFIKEPLTAVFTCN